MDIPLEKIKIVGDKCCKCGDPATYLLGGPLKKFPHCKNCYNIICGVENKNGCQPIVNQI